MILNSLATSGYI